MVLSRWSSLFLAAVGVWTWAIWPRFALAIWNEPRSWSTGRIAEGSGTAFLWVHVLLIAASLAIGTLVAVIGVRGLLALRRTRRSSAPGRP